MLLSNEEKIICLLSRLRPSPENITQTQQVTAAGIDFGKLLHLATVNGVSPLLYVNLRDSDIVPDDITANLRNIYLNSVAANLKKRSVLMRLLALLKKNGIPAIPVKGVIASELIFKNAGLYYGSDIDILVKPNELQDVKKILIDAGYDYDEESEKDMLSSHYHLVFYDGQHLVEVHWNLTKRYFDIPPKFWWEDIVTEQYQGQEILCLSPEKYLMCLIFRLFSHMFNPLKFLVLVSELCNTYSKNIDWSRFSRFTKAYGMDRLSTFSLKISNELLGTKVPDHILNTKIAGYNFFKRSIINQLFRDVRRPHMGKLLYILLMDSTLQICCHLILRIFPKQGELRRRYRIPEGSKSIFFYYALNPILLPFLVLRKRFDLRSKGRGA
jgi:hypothetical protein